MKSLKLATLSALVVMGTACNSKAPSPAACAPTEGWPEVLDLAGDYAVSMIANRGIAAGTEVAGTMTLNVNDQVNEVAPGYRNVFFGTVEVDLDAIGALEMGSLSSDDPTRPGVLVQVNTSDGIVGVLLRLGSEANRTDVTRFDGGYTVLRVNSMTDNGFGGNWTSGISRTDAEGTFCAVRM